VSAHAENRLLLPLIGLAAALGLWLVSERVELQVRELEQQLANAVRPVRSTAGMLEQAEQSARSSAARRATLEARLQSREPTELLQTRFLHELRQRCSAAGINSCAVKYSAEPTRGGSGTPAARAASAPRALATLPDSEVGLEDLGLAKARAVISGTFQNDELLAYVDTLTNDPVRFWRVNGLVVRGNNFELDVEQIVRPPAGAQRLTTSQP
jgi:hypothetical protein